MYYTCIYRLKKVTITTPKAKEYKKIFENRKEVLRQYHLDVDNMAYGGYCP